MIREPLIFAKEALKNKEDVIRQIAGAAKEEGVLRDPEEFMEAVLQREEEVSTSIGYGIAIPHGKTDAVKEPFISFYELRDTIHLGPRDGRRGQGRIPHRRAGDEYRDAASKGDRRHQQEAPR